MTLRQKLKDKKKEYFFKEDSVEALNPEEYDSFMYSIDDPEREVRDLPVLEDQELPF
jgi:hypothetical protein